MKNNTFKLFLATTLIFGVLIISGLSKPLNAQVDNLLKLTIIGNSYSDQTFVVFVPGSTTGFDSEYDAYKLMGIYAAPQLYSIITCCNLSVNALPDINTNLEVQLGFRVGADVSYTIYANELNSFGSDTTITLEDTKENVFLELMTDSIYTFDGFTTDDTERFKLHFNFPMKLDATVFLEGPFNGTSMDASLNSEGLIPLAQPFNTAPWNYTGTESVGAIPNGNVIDWVLVEIRDAVDAASANSSTIVETQACFLLNDGSVVGLDGTSYPEFKETIYENPFVVIWHRNHLGVMAASPLVRTAGVYPYDFTTAITQAYGSGQKHIGGGIYGMIGGDGDASGSVDATDKTSFWSIIAGTKGYVAGDYSLNGQVSNQDKNDIWEDNQGENEQVP